MSAHDVLRKADDHREMARFLARVLDSYPLTSEYRETCKARLADHRAKSRRYRALYYSKVRRS